MKQKQLDSLVHNRAKALCTNVAVLIAGVIVLTGCTSTEQPVGPPEPEVQALSMSPRGDMLYRCLRDAGWDMAIDWDGGVIADSDSVPIDQEPLYTKDSAACLAEVEIAFSLDDTEKRAVYQTELKTRTCLIEHGFDIPDPPSEQTYLDNYANQLWMAWSYVDLRNMDAESYKSLNTMCPQPQWSAGGAN